MSFALKKNLDANLPAQNGPDHGQLMGQAELRRMFLQIAQGYGLKVNLSFRTPEKKAVEGIGSFTAPFMKGSYELSGINSAQISGLCGLLGEIPSVSIGKMAFDGKGWQVSGELFAR